MHRQIQGYSAMGLAVLLAMSACTSRAAQPAYETETWPQARKLVWKKDNWGKYHVTGSWLENGRTAKSPPDRNTDVEFPDGNYRVEVSGFAEARHITIGRGVTLRGAHLGPTLETWGNVDVKPGGRIYSVVFKGPKHTYLKVADARLPGPETQFDKGGYGWHPSCISHKLQVNKFGNASVEFIGEYGVTDEIMIQHGTLIVNGQLRWSGRADKAALEIYDGATLELQSGAIVGPFRHDNTKHVFNLNVYRNGRLEAGSAERPLTKDAYILLGMTPPDPPGLSGLFAARGSQIRVHTSRPGKARLVISSVTQVPLLSAEGKPLGSPQDSAKGTHGIQLQLGCDTSQFSSMAFDYVAQGGLKLRRPEQAAEWTDVSFGSHNAAAKKQLIAEMTFDPDSYYHERKWWKDEYVLVVKARKDYEQALADDPYQLQTFPEATEQVVVGKQGSHVLTKQAPIVYADPVEIEITTARDDAKVYYTMDGSAPSARSTLYTKPIVLKRTTQLRAVAIAPGMEPSLEFNQTYVFE